MEVEDLKICWIIDERIIYLPSIETNLEQFMIIILINMNWLGIEHLCCHPHDLTQCKMTSFKRIFLFNRTAVRQQFMLVKLLVVSRSLVRTQLWLWLVSTCAMIEHEQVFVDSGLLSKNRLLFRWVVSDLRSNWSGNWTRVQSCNWVWAHHWIKVLTWLDCYLFNQIIASLYRVCLFRVLLWRYSKSI